MRPVTASNDKSLTHWLATHAGIAEARPGPYLTGGNANVTRLIESPQGRFVLRHPPADVVSDKAAAGIAREFTALKALHGRAPVPQTHAKTGSGPVRTCR